jgi:putative acetyltransferase
MNAHIRLDDLSDPRIAEFLEEHLTEMRSVSPPESVHALDLARLRQPEITFWSAWSGSDLVGCAALKRLDAKHAELKSMRTSSRHRRQGVGKLILEHVLSEARRLGYLRMSLETGSMAFFEPAHALYASYGFVRCAPFANYREDPNSVCMTCAL